MKKSLFVSFLCAVVVCAFALSSVSASNAPDGLKMAKTKKPVTFNHSTHKSAKCADCHHKSGGDESKIKACSAAGCHDNMNKKDKSDASYYKAMHGKGKTISSCVSCHKKTAGKDKAMKKKLAGCKKSVCHP